MSGGSYDYAYQHLDNLADAIEEREKEHNSPAHELRMLFVQRLRLIARAAKEIEWADSHDTSPGCAREVDAILLALKP
jgi:hypothetical protein